MRSSTLDPVPISLTISGDPIVGRALVLLLRGSRYDPKFLPASSLKKSGALRGIRILLLTPTPGVTPWRREVLPAALGEEVGTANTSTLELVVWPEEAQGGEARDDISVHAVPWPCSIEELEQRIEGALKATTPVHQRSTC